MLGRHAAGPGFLPGRAITPLPLAGSLPETAPPAQPCIPWSCSAARHGGPRNEKGAATPPDLARLKPGAGKPGHRPPRSQHRRLAPADYESAGKAKTMPPESLPAIASRCDEWSEPG